MLVLRYCLKPYPDRKETGHERACRRMDDETFSDRNGDNTNPAGTHALECRLEGSHIGDGIVDGFDVPNVSSLLMVLKVLRLARRSEERRNIRGGKCLDASE